jgi:hypothetical protein
MAISENGPRSWNYIQLQAMFGSKFLIKEKEKCFPKKAFFLDLFIWVERRKVVRETKT